MRHFVRQVWVWVLLGGITATAPADVQLAGMFSDNMILQRDSGAPVWGTADPSEPITLTIQDQKITTVTGLDGKWRAVFQGLKAGGPFTLTVTGTTQKITLNNVAVGDIWICSGQSNMEYRLADKDEIAKANYPDIRYYSVSNLAQLDPVTDEKGKWQIVTPATVTILTATGYYFATNIQRELGIPIGLIRCSWSGARIEPFIAGEDLDSVPGLKEVSDTAIQKLRDVAKDAEKFPLDLEAWQEKYGRADTENKGFAAKWADPAFDDKDWISVVTPGDWSKLGAPNGGVIWLRKTVQLPPEAAGKDFTLSTGATHVMDTTYFNGEQVGTVGTTSPDYWNAGSDVIVPGRLVKAGANLIALRLVSQRSKEYPLYPGSRLGLHVADPKSVSDDWLAKVETTYTALPDGALAELPQPPTAKAFVTPSTIFNGTIRPITSYGIKGVLWYQGESSAANPWAYRTLLPLLIKSWRTHWGIGDFPFYIVQLPNFGIPPTFPGQGDLHWAELREAQLLTWEKVPNTAMSVSIDVGRDDNLHPPDKKDIGYRLSLLALGNTYGRKIEYSGPIYDSMTVEANKIRLKFTHLGGGLIAKGGRLQQFVICGADQKWHGGEAVIDGDTVVVSSPDVVAPVAARYAWAAAPDGCNLYNQAGLPASPFRTDDWPVEMENKW